MRCGNAVPDAHVEKPWKTEKKSVSHSFPTIAWITPQELPTVTWKNLRFASILHTFPQRFFLIGDIIFISAKRKKESVKTNGGIPKKIN
jgi:hypothetical protein